MRRSILDELSAFRARVELFRQMIQSNMAQERGHSRGASSSASSDTIPNLTDSSPGKPARATAPPSSDGSSDESSEPIAEEFRRPVIRFPPETNSRSPRKRPLSIYFVQRPTDIRTMIGDDASVRQSDDGDDIDLETPEEDEQEEAPLSK
jgi:hypothetical protein